MGRTDETLQARAAFFILNYTPINIAKYMLSPRLRPRFEMHVARPSIEVVSSLSALIDGPNKRIIGAKAGNHFHLNFNKSNQRLWSPHLGLEIEHMRGGTLIKGHFGPRADIWTLVMALYAITGFVGFMALLFGISQWMLGMNPWSLWIAGGAIGIGMIVYALALAGQSLSQKQMAELLGLVEQVTGGEVIRH